MSDDLLIVGFVTENGGGAGRPARRPAVTRETLYLPLRRSKPLVTLRERETLYLSGIRKMSDRHRLLSPQILKFLIFTLVLKIEELHLCEDRHAGEQNKKHFARAYDKDSILKKKLVVFIKLIFFAIRPTSYCTCILHLHAPAYCACMPLHTALACSCILHLHTAPACCANRRSQLR